MKDVCPKKYSTEVSGTEVSKATNEIILSYFSYECTHSVTIYSYCWHNSDIHFWGSKSTADMKKHTGSRREGSFIIVIIKNWI